MNLYFVGGPLHDKIIIRDGAPPKRVYVPEKPTPHGPDHAHEYARREDGRYAHVRRYRLGETT